MKRLIFTLLSVLFVLAGCTTEKPVYKDYDVETEVDAFVSTEYAVVYCNLHDEGIPSDLAELEAYVKSYEPDVFIFSGKTNAGVQLEAWATTMATSLTEARGVEFKASTLSYDSNLLAIVARGAAPEFTSIKDDVKGVHALYVKYDQTYILCSVLAPGKTQIDNEMREAQVASLVAQTIDNPSLDGSRWIWAIDMRSPSELDNQKYNKDHDPNATRANYLLKYNGMVDCIAAQSNVYPATDVNGQRYNFVYATNLGWQMMSPLTLDVEVAEALGMTIYPVVFTIKNEE